MNPEFVRNTISTLLDLFQRQDFPEILAHNIIRRHPDDSIPSQKWSLANRLLMVLSGTTDARGYMQWRSVGRNVRKGASSIRIIAPITQRIVRAPELDEEPARQLVGFCPIAVFPVEATDGEPLPVFNYEPPAPPPLWNVASLLGIHVNYAPFSGRFLGCYRPGANQIVLCSQDEFVFYHEISHGILHSLPIVPPMSSQREEAVVEMAAAVLCQIQGVRGFEHSSYRYIARHTEGKDPTSVLAALMGMLTDVEKVVCRILQVAAEDTSAVPPVEIKNSVSA